MFAWGKHHATRAGAETLTDAVEEINLCVEDADTFKEAVAETWVDVTGQENEGSVRDEARKVYTEIQDASTSQPNKKPITSKKRRKTDDALNDFVVEIQEYVVAVKEANEELKGISSYFKDQAESNHRKMKIFDEIMELSGFSEQEIIDVGEYILKDTNKVDTFFAFPKAFRRTYVAKQLFEATPYRPTFYFQDENGI